MPFLIYSAKLCPPGLEGTLFALFMSINNFSYSCASWSGAALQTWLGITSTDFDQLWLSLQHELCETIERSMEEHVQLTRTTHEHVHDRAPGPTAVSRKMLQ